MITNIGYKTMNYACQAITPRGVALRRTARIGPLSQLSVKYSYSSSSRQTTLMGISTKATELEKLDPSLIPQKLSLIQLAKAYFKFYKAALSQLRDEFRAARGIRQRIKNGNKITWHEHQIMYRSDKDFIKLIPFGFLLLTVAEFIPILVFLFPNSIPSAAVTHKQKTKMIRAKDEYRRNVHNSIVAMSNTNTNTNTNTSSGGDKSDGQAKIDRTGFTTIASIKQLYSKYPTSFDLNEADRKTLKFMSKYFGISVLGTKSILVNRINKHFGYIKKDDELLTTLLYLSKEGKNYSGGAGGVGVLTDNQVIDACDTRGITTTGHSVSQLRVLLGKWIAMRQNGGELFNSNDSVGILVWSRLFLLDEVPN